MDKQRHTAALLRAPRVVIMILLTMSFLFTGCAQKADFPPQSSEQLISPLVPAPQEQPAAQPAVTPTTRHIDLTYDKYQGVDLLRVFDDYSGVADIFVFSGKLLYSWNDSYWKTELTGEHVPITRVGMMSSRKSAEESPTYSSFYDVLAYGRTDTGQSLVLMSSEGVEIVLFSGATELEILGWSPLGILFYAELPDLGRNVWHIIVDDYLTMMTDQYVAAQALDSLPITNLQFACLVQGNVELMWPYGEALAYALDGVIYLIDEYEIKTLYTEIKSPVVWADRNLILTHDKDGGKSPELLYNGKSAELSTTNTHFSREVDWDTMRFYYTTLNDGVRGIAEVDIETMEARQLFKGAEGFGVGFALSPDKTEIMVSQSAAVDPNYQWTDYINHLSILNLSTGQIRTVLGPELDPQIPSYSRYSCFHWAEGDLLLLGTGFQYTPYNLHLCLLDMDGCTLLPHYAVWKPIDLYTNDLRYVFVSGVWDPTPGGGAWYYDSEDQELRMLIDERYVCRSRAYNEQSRLLFIERDIYTRQGMISRVVTQGLLMDLHGNAYTLMTDENIRQAIWIGAKLYVSTRNEVLRISFDYLH